MRRFKLREGGEVWAQKVGRVVQGDDDFAAVAKHQPLRLLHRGIEVPKLVVAKFGAQGFHANIQVS